MANVATISFLPKYFSYKKIIIYVKNINMGVIPKCITLNESAKRPKIKTKIPTFIFLNINKIATEKTNTNGNEITDDSINNSKKPKAIKKNDNWYFFTMK